MTTGIVATYLKSDKFSIDENMTDVFTANKRVKAECAEDGIKYGNVLTSSFVPSAGKTKVTLTNESEDLTSNLTHVWYEVHPHMEDGRPIVRSDTRPLNTSTYFTCAGDNDGVGKGKALRWDFSNSDDLYTGSECPSGYKAKEISITFNCPVHIKDGAIYFFDAPWGQYMHMDIVVPTGHYYPNPAGMIPASALGLPGKKMYAQATEDTVFQRYVNRHYVYGNCPMGDELNAEGAAVEALPIGWKIRGLIVTPESDNVSKGYSSLEMYRCHTWLLPGMSNPHA